MSAEALRETPGPLILVAEDNEVNQQVVRGALEAAGFRADIVPNGLQALAALERTSYAAVLMDCQMPEMDGYAATAAIREREGAERHTPIIALTAHALPGDREKCLAAGMDDYIAKPFKPEQLYEALERAIGLLPAALPPATRPAAIAQDVIDYSDLDDLRKFDPEDAAGFLRNVIDLFVKHTPERLRAITVGMAEHAPQDVAKAAHMLKGSCGSVGAHNMACLCADIQMLAEAGRLSALPPMFDRLRDEYARVAGALERYMTER